MGAPSLHRRRLYLVVDPAPGAGAVLPRVEAALRGGVEVLQIWNHWGAGADPVAFVERVLEAARPHDVPVLVHEDVELLAATPAQGIHLDAPRPDMPALRERIGRAFLYGQTCGNDLGQVDAALEAGADYISFCALFPSSSAPDCERVSLETVRGARARTAIPIYASGGITPGNAASAIAAGADGVAVISGVLGAPDPQAAALRYARSLSAPDPEEAPPR